MSASRAFEDPARSVRRLASTDLRAICPTCLLWRHASGRLATRASEAGQDEVREREVRGVDLLLLGREVDDPDVDLVAALLD